MINIDKMNECLRAGLDDPAAQKLCNKVYDHIAEFTANHMTDAAGKLIKDSDTTFDRGEMISRFINELHDKIFQHKPNQAIDSDTNQTAGRAGY